MRRAVAMVLLATTIASAQDLPEGALARLGSARFRAAGFTVAIAASPDGKRVAVTTESGARAWFFDVATGKRERSYELATQGKAELAYSPDGKRLACYVLARPDAPASIEIVDAVELKLERRIGIDDGLSSPGCPPAWSADGAQLAVASEHGKVVVLDAASGSPVRTLATKGDAAIESVAFARDGRLGAAGRGFHLWDREGNEVRSCEGDYVAFSPDGKLVAVSTETRVELRSAETFEVLRAVPFTEPLFAGRIFFSPDGKTLAAPLHYRVHMGLVFVDVATGAVRQTEGHPSGEAGAFLGDATFALGGNGALRLVDVASGKERAEPGHAVGVTAVAFSRAGDRIATADAGDTIRLWSPDGASLQLVHTSTPTRALAFVGPDLAHADATSVAILGSRTIEIVVRIAPEGGDDVSVSPDEKLLVTGSSKDGVRLFTPDGKLVRALEPGEGSWFPTLAFCPDGKRVAGGSIDGIVRVWPIDGERSIDIQDRKGAPGERDVTRVAWSPDGKSIATSGRDGSLIIRDGTNGKELARLRGHAPKAALVVAFSPDGKRLASAGEDGTVRLWDVAAAKEARSFSGHEGSVAALAFSPDGTKLVSGGADGTAIVWKVP